MDTAANETNNDRKAALEIDKMLTNNSQLAYPDNDDELYVDGKKDKGLTDEGIAHFAAVYKQMPMLSATQNSLLALFADRDRVKGLGEGISAGKGGWASILEVIKYEVERRYMSEKWHKTINEEASELAILREIANMMAFQMYLDYKTYEQNSRIESLMAAQVSGINGLNRMMTSTSMSGSGESVEGIVEEEG